MLQICYSPIILTRFYYIFSTRCKVPQIYYAHEDTCMLNNPKMDYKGQTVVLSVMFVLVGTMILVPLISEKALATINARAITSDEILKFNQGGFYNIRPQLGSGHITYLSHVANQIFWRTASGGLIGSEEGNVAARFGDFGYAVFHFNNPASGANTCQAKSNQGLSECMITQGLHAVASYIICALIEKPVCDRSVSGYCFCSPRHGADTSTTAPGPREDTSDES